MKKQFALFIAAIFLLAASSLSAQGGCVNSPENPTAILALGGSAGAIFVSVRARIRARRAR
jgi:XrtJ-associated TM-motif-TM protein